MASPKLTRSTEYWSATALDTADLPEAIRPAKATIIYRSRSPRARSARTTHARRSRSLPSSRSLSRPLTILGAERKLFFFAMCLGAATFNLLDSLLGGLLIFSLLYFLARWATQTRATHAVRSGRTRRTGRKHDARHYHHHGHRAQQTTHCLHGATSL